MAQSTLTIGVLPVAAELFELFPEMLRLEIGDAVVDSVPTSSIEQLARESLDGVIAHKALREKWEALWPANSLDWPAKYVAAVELRIRAGRTRLSFHQMALEALMVKVASRCYRVWQAGRDRVKGFDEFTAFQPCEGCEVRGSDQGNTCFRTADFDWLSYMTCDKLACNCSASLFQARAVRKLIESGFVDATKSTPEPVRLL